jgi:hypothetical protein
MSPFQHGEVFVTNDGAETDLDLGHYERFVRLQLGKKKKEELIETENDKDDHKANFIQNLPQALPTKFQLIWPMTNKNCPIIIDVL